MLSALSRIMPYLLMAVLILNLLQRGLTKPDSPARAAGQPRPGDSPRVATLILAGLVLATWAAVLLLQRWQAPEWTGALPAAAAAGGALLCLRARRNAFPRRCRHCGRRLPLGVTLGFDAAAAARYAAGACPAPDCAAAQSRSAARDQ